MCIQRKDLNNLHIFSHFAAQKIIKFNTQPCKLTINILLLDLNAASNAAWH